MRPPANAATAPAAARPMPRNPTIRPRSRAGYIVPHRRRWNGPPNDRLSQNAIEMATITAGVGQMKSASSEAAPRPRRTASWTGERAPNRPAKTPSRFAMKGAAASAARPSGSRPPRRAIVGRRAVMSAAVTPDADRRGEVEREIAPERAPTGRWLE